MIVAHSRKSLTSESTGRADTIQASIQSIKLRNPDLSGLTVHMLCLCQLNEQPNPDVSSSRRRCGQTFDEQPQRENDLEYERRQPLVVSGQRPCGETSELQGQ